MSGLTVRGHICVFFVVLFFVYFVFLLRVPLVWCVQFSKDNRHHFGGPYFRAHMGDSQHGGPLLCV